MLRDYRARSKRRTPAFGVFRRTLSGRAGKLNIYPVAVRLPAIHSAVSFLYFISSASLGEIAAAQIPYPFGERWRKSGMTSRERLLSESRNLSPISRK